MQSLKYLLHALSADDNPNEDLSLKNIASLATDRRLINLVVQNQWPLYQLNINNAFLYGDLSETVYMSLADGFFKSNKKRVCKLKKSLYGLKQAPKQWNDKLTQVLLENGFSQSKSDYSLFTKSHSGMFVALLVYGDDLIITCNNLNEIKKCEDFLKSKFQIKDLGKLKYFVACKPFAIPLEQDLSIYSVPSDKDPILDNIIEYQKLICKLICLTHTRVFRYLKGFTGKGIHIVKCPSVSLETFVDAVCQAAIKSAANPVFHERTKYLEINLHFVREKIINGVIETVKVQYAEQAAFGNLSILRGLILPSVESLRFVLYIEG
ncbi:ribonuclease H-like domain-containing protein [Tanacetum coccineum]